MITEKGGQQRRMEFDKNEVTIGRVQGNDIILPKGNVSKRHSRIVLKDNRFIVVDLKSTNGTYVNGRKITSPLVVKPGDKVYIGDFIMNVEEMAPANAGPPPLSPPNAGPPPLAPSNSPSAPPPAFGGGASGGFAGPPSQGAPASGGFSGPPPLGGATAPPPQAAPAPAPAPMAVPAPAPAPAPGY
ncbi:MAG: FHA domain-containing protein [Myxococcota bacterium]